MTRPPSTRARCRFRAGAGRHRNHHGPRHRQERRHDFARRQYRHAHPGTSLTLESGSTSLFEESNSVAGDVLQVQGNLTIQSNCTIAVSVLGAALEPVTNTLITYTGTKSGSFNPTVVVAGGIPQRIGFP